MISTNAFGMGIDKEKCEICNSSSPAPSLENYYQEIGRAGRDGEKVMLLLWNEQELLNLDDVFIIKPSKSEF